MKAWWLNLLDSLRSSYWFVPTLMGLAACVLAVGTIAGDVALGPGRNPGWLHAGGPQAARTVLTALLAATITVLTVVFSVTIVTLNLASTQFGPRMLRTFMMDRGTQVVLGAFVGALVYCLLVVAVIGQLEARGVIPHICVLGAMLLTLLNLGMLIFFIHHIAESMQSFEVVAAVSRELEESIDRMFPDPILDAASGAPPHGAPPRPGADPPRVGEPATVRCPRSDYIRSIDFDALSRIVQQHDLSLEVMYRAGDFVRLGDVIARAWPADRLGDAADAAIRAAFILGNRRNPTQDVEFSVRQLVEICVRSLSPAVNDPFTAIDCVDRLGAALARLAGRDMSDPYGLGQAAARITADASTFTGVVDIAFDQVRQHGRRDVAVTIRLLETLQHLGPHLRTADQRRTLRRHAKMIHRGALDALPEPDDRADVEDRYCCAMAALEG